MRLRRGLAALGAAVIATGCGGGGASPPPPPACDGSCQDDVAVQAIRDAIKLAYNEGLQGKPVGAQDAHAPCPLGGSVHVTGTATSNADLGLTNVALTYAFDACAYARTDTDAKSTYAVTVSGTFTENGIVSVQPTSTTALTFHADDASVKGTVYAPAIPYQTGPCPLVLGQSGNDLAGTLCGRQVGLTL